MTKEMWVERQALFDLEQQARAKPHGESPLRKVKQVIHASGNGDLLELECGHRAIGSKPGQTAKYCLLCAPRLGRK
jgi:hypothetical protein